MKSARLEEMTKGWIVGDFVPAVLNSTAMEVAIKHYRCGDREALHHHKVATEVTAIVSGHVTMCGRNWGPGDVITIEPGEATAFTALTDAVTVVVKAPSVKDDKFSGEVPPHERSSTRL
ncbi:hypothetical protein [Methylobacterium frigidaeris]|jgi:quercetin dioxygenase-like cupin family protein|uniref:Cupin n=1 Tax=Methylobacterium frigidaeris TaxID=2038277 RepID=A0AA37HEH2_9HYPH|nr:hypothetical protein [Methylobacterium frigidaeris]GJD64274.1 hypothetical protein MPEAHAMD_4455 [Methylobacterium frigidaeris]